MTTILFVLGLTVVWVLAWGSLSVANVLSGLLVATGLVLVTPDDWSWTGRRRVRPRRVARFVGHVLVKAVQSNASVARDALARRPRVRTGVIAIDLPGASDGLVTLIANLMALTPGTMPLEVDRGPSPVLYVHVLDLSDGDATRRDIRRLTELAYDAFAPEEACAALAERPLRPTHASDPEGAGS